MLSELMNRTMKISVIGLGYVGLPLAVALAKHFRVIAFDIDKEKIQDLTEGDAYRTQLDLSKDQSNNLLFTDDARSLSQAQMYFVCVPTNVFEDKTPDLSPLEQSSKLIGKYLNVGDIVVYESTVYPGCTEEICIPILEEESRLTINQDFSVGYSPERIVPGDDMHALESIVKIASASNETALNTICITYETILKNKIYKTSSIKVAEAAKVIENTQRDLNISLMNELAILLSKLDINTKEVLDAASTKWNFHRYTPGLVGGHCINVDPFYLLYKSRQVGYEPQVIAAGRHVNDSIPSYICDSLIEDLRAIDKNPSTCKVLIMGLSFKENVADYRNSKVIDLYDELKSKLHQVEVEDAWIDLKALEKSHPRIIARRDVSDENDKPYDAIIVATGHEEYHGLKEEYFINRMGVSPILYDIKGIYVDFHNLTYWTL